MIHGGTPAVEGPPAHRFLVPGLVFIGMVVAVVGSLGAPLIPTLSAVDHVSLDDAQWSLTIAFLVSAVATPTMGRLGDGPHRREVILVGLGLVAAGGVMAALPLGFGVLLVGRGLQGIGLGLTPLVITVARDALPPHKARPALAILSITTVAGVGLGYPVTAVIAEHGGLHTAFWFGAAVAVAALLVAAAVVPSSANHPPARLDLWGAVALGAALAALLLAISEGESWGWVSFRVIGLAVAALIVLVAWVVLELHRAHPLVELRLLRNIVVLTADATGILAGIGMYLLISLVTRFVQTPTSSGYGPGGSIAIAGLMLTPFSVGSVAASRVTRILTRRMSPGRILPLGSALLLASMAMFSFARGGLWEIAIVMAIAGLGVGSIFAVMPGFIVREVPVHETGSALSFNQVLRYIGYGVGSSLSAVILQAHTAPGHSLPAGNGYTDAGLITCGIWIAAITVSLGLPYIRGRAVPAATVETPDEQADLAVMEDESLAAAVPYEDEDDERGATLAHDAPTR